MSEIIERDAKSGRFLAGNGGGGRKPGARNKLGGQFIEDLRDVWHEKGIEALRRCADEEPAQFVRVVASLMPKDIDINFTANASEDAVAFSLNFRAALQMIHGKTPSTIEH